jgi:chromosome segregation ATPase
MSALDTAKELGRMAATATLSKDAIGLFEKKVALLTEQVAALETENAELKNEAGNLEKELTSLRQKEGRLEEGAEKFLVLLFRQGDSLSTDAIAAELNISQGMAQYHADALYQREMIGWAGVADRDSGRSYSLCAKGREYVIKNGLVK